MSSPISIVTPTLRGNEWSYLKECLDSGWVSSAGSYVDQFENKIASYLGVEHSIASINGTSALHIALLVAGVDRGDEVLVPTLSFIAPANAVTYLGAAPVFFDCDDYLNIDPVKVGEYLRTNCECVDGQTVNKQTKKSVKAMIVVHTFGHPANMDALMQVADEFNLVVVEDAAEAFSSVYIKGKYAGQKAGSIGHIGCLSFNGNKIITAGGGGMIVTNNKMWARRARYLTTQAKDDAVYSIHNSVGFNYRLSNLHAAVGLAQLEQAKEFTRIKRENFVKYQKLISPINGLQLIEEPTYAESNYWYYSLVVDRRQSVCSHIDLMGILAKESIESKPIWTLNHLQKPYLGCTSYNIKNAVKFSKQVLSLPCSVTLSDQQIHRIVDLIRNATRRKSHENPLEAAPL